MSKWAIVGAGISGLSCATTLQQCKSVEQIVIIDKSRGVSGRIATRHVRSQTGEQLNTSTIAQFDHGAQYFTVRSNEFKYQVDKWLSSGVVQPWQANIKAVDASSYKVENTINHNRQGSLSTSQDASSNNSVVRYVGVPGNSAFCKDYARKLESLDNVKLQLATEVSSLTRVRDKWQLTTTDGSSDVNNELFDGVILSVPASQADTILSKSNIQSLPQQQKNEIQQIKKKLQTVKLGPTWALMIQTTQSLRAAFGIPFDAAFINNSPIFSWIACNSSKPGRAPTANDNQLECWVAHANATWSEANIELTKEDAANILIEEFNKLMLGIASNSATNCASTTATVCNKWLETNISYVTTHRWRYAVAAKILKESFVYSSALKLGCCGDWAGGPRVEGAWLSGKSLADSLLRASL